MRASSVWKAYFGLLHICRTVSHRRNNPRWLQCLCWLSAAAVFPFTEPAVAADAVVALAASAARHSGRRTFFAAALAAAAASAASFAVQW